MSFIFLQKLAIQISKMPTPQEYLASPKWVEKMKQSFTILDRNKNGYLSQEDWTVLVDTLKKLVKMGPGEEEKLREAYVKYASALGAKPGVRLDVDDYLQSVAKFASNQEESRKLLAEVNKASFAVIDTNDDGTISLVEYTKICEASNMTADIAKATFDAIDKNHNGKVELKELAALDDKFWFSLD